jgi:metal-responsive CopG/Arc/MetJ family transcriptional regulator
MAKELKRLNMNMPVELVEQVDVYAEKMNVNRSSAINMLVSTALEAKNAVSTLEKLLMEMQNSKNKALLQ